MSEKKNEQANAIRKKVIVIVIMIAITAYVIYAIYLLIKQPTNIFTIEEGKLYQEETSVRLYYKRRSSS